MKMRIIIPSAKIVPEELQKIGKLPAIIYPINQKITFEYIYDQYKDKGYEVDVVCYENADKVKRRLEGYAAKNVKTLVLPELRDLGYTILYAIENVEEPIIINFADTIVLDSIDSIKGDAFFCQEDSVCETWTYFDESNGEITAIYDKEKADKETKKRLFVGVFQIADTAFFAECLKNALLEKNASISSFYRALQCYSVTHPMLAIQTDKWFDIGHEDKYYDSSLEVKAREFNHITIDKNRGILRKTSEDKDKFIGEIRWYLKLPSDIEYVRPRIFSYSTSYEAPYVNMEYYAYHTVHEMFLYGDLSAKQWADIFARIRFIYQDFERYTVEGDNIKSSLEDMYLTKTLQRFEKLKKDTHFYQFFDKPILVNNKLYKPLNEIIDILKRVIPENLYDVAKFNIIHGDLCFANIMVDSNLSFVKVIDPRGKFGAYDIYGDSRYELAKLFHSVDGKYDFIIKDLFDLKFDINKPSIEYSIKDRIRSYNVYDIFLEVFREDIGRNLKKIELIESLLFLSMIPLHGESLKHQLIMLGTGLDILNRVVDITC